MTDRLPLLAGIALLVFGLFVWAVSHGPVEEPCAGMSVVGPPQAGRDYVKNGTYLEWMKTYEVYGHLESKWQHSAETEFVPNGQPAPDGYYWQNGITDVEKVRMTLVHTRSGCLRGELNFSYSADDWENGTAMNFEFREDP